MILSPSNCSEKMSPMKEMVTLNKKELSQTRLGERRLVVLNQVDRGEMIGRQVAEVD